MPRHLCVMRPMRSTAVASTTTMPARATANCIRCARCQSVALPSSAEYWHIGETAMRLGSVSGPTLRGSKRLGTGLGPDLRAVAGLTFTAAPVGGNAKIERGLGASVRSAPLPARSARGGVPTPRPHRRHPLAASQFLLATLRCNIRLRYSGGYSLGPPPGAVDQRQRRHNVERAAK